MATQREHLEVEEGVGASIVIGSWEHAAAPRYPTSEKPLLSNLKLWPNMGDVHGVVLSVHKPMEQMSLKVRRNSSYVAVI
ncbi:hypothetical protein B296_00051766 [Ensete ventricosum]|uniref:Uncharacterized protein n=1 Tax=Ensete ventricosum TaxID=4639 RepID=A0A426X6K9_ENSVE|nr:hypothetical protein B296_00051766 [Ensete ventricosum]